MEAPAFNGSVTEVGFASGGGASTYPVVVALERLDDALRPGMAAEVTVQFSAATGPGLAVPASAVINDERGTFVFVAVPADDDRATIERRDVQIGELTEAGVEITAGLTEGDRIVTAGTSVIREQQIVLLPQG